MRAGWWLLAVACHGPDADDSGTVPTDETGATSTETPTPTPTPTDTGEEPTTPSTFGTPSEVSVSCDPTANPLRFVCHVTVDPPQPVQVAFEKADGSGGARVHAGPEVAGTQDVPLFFLAPDTAYAVTATATAFPTGPVGSTSITTGTVPTDRAGSLAVTGVSSTPYVGAGLPCGDGAYAAVFDTATGEMLWYQEISPDGSFGGMQMASFTEDHTLLGQDGQQVVEVDLDGVERFRKVHGVDYEDELHHDLFKRDGLIYLLYEVPAALRLDGFLIWDQTGAEVGRWFAADHLAIPGGASGDFMHTNTIFVEGGAAYLSSYTQHTVFKVDADLASPTFGEPQWMLAGSAASQLGDDFLLDWSAVGGSDGFGRQHDAHLTPDGRLILLDNDHGRALRVTLDEVALTATVDDSYAAGFGNCGPQGTAAQTAAGNVLVDCSGMSLREYETGGTSPVWTAALTCAGGTGLGGGPGPVGVMRWTPLDGW